MRIISCKSLLQLGRTLTITARMDYTKPIVIYGDEPAQTGLVPAFNSVVVKLKDLGLSPSTTKEIEDFLQKIKGRNYKAVDTLILEHRRIIKERSKFWQDRIFESAQNLSAAILSKDHNLNPGKLALGAVEFFAPETWPNISEIAKRDLDESLKCILFQLPTPSGILALRATEAELRIFYSKKTGKEVNQTMNWGSIIRQLRGEGINTTLIGNLDYLRENLRNKLHHPDATLTQLEAENIFPTIATTISEMALNTK